MASSVEMLRAIVAPLSLEANEVTDLMDDARNRGVDPLRLLAHQFGISEEQIMSRAARYCGLAFAPELPQGCRHVDMPGLAVEALADIQSMRCHVYDREVVFAAPSFYQLLNLAIHLNSKPALLRQTCIVPLSALKAGLLQKHNQELMTHARQHLTRKWPFANAHLELTLGYRLFFAAALLAIALLTVASPFVLQPILLPILCIFLLLPAWFRLSAVFDEPPTNRSPPDLLEDADLPIYSVLIPLRDEAGIVRQLASAMLALDYPALCIKRTKTCDY